MTYRFYEGRVNTNLSIDRIDSTKGYTRDNVQLVTVAANQMKNDLTTVELIDLCQRVIKQQERSNMTEIPSNYTIATVTEHDGVGRFITRNSNDAFCLTFQYSDDCYKNILYISRIAVADSVKQKGYGSELLKYCDELGKDLGVEKLRLSVIDDSWQHLWYKNHGYIDVELDEQNNNYIWMEKQLMQQNN